MPAEGFRAPALLGRPSRHTRRAPESRARRRSYAATLRLCASSWAGASVAGSAPRWSLRSERSRISTWASSITVARHCSSASRAELGQRVAVAAALGPRWLVRWPAASLPLTSATSLTGSRARAIAAQSCFSSASSFADGVHSAAVAFSRTCCGVVAPGITRQPAGRRRAR